MKKEFTAIILSVASIGSASAQSLFDFAPDEAETESFPLKWTAGLNIGYDDNPVPFSSADDSTLYAQAYVGASLLNNTAQTTTEFFANVGVLHYFDSLEGSADDTSPTLGAGLNWTHRISERLRVASRNFVKFEVDPDYTTNFTNPRDAGSYLRWSTNNSVGYRWTERLGTYTGFILDGIEYDDSDFDDLGRFNWTLYNQFRYQISPQTVLTFHYRYKQTSGDGAARDSTRQTILAGIESQLSPNTAFTLRAGVQLRDIDGPRGSSSSPHIEAGLRTQVNEALSLRGYVRFSNEDYSKFVNTTQFEGSDTLRIGVNAQYRVSQDLTLNGGVNYTQVTFVDDLNGVSPDVDEDAFNASIGFDYRISNGMFVTGTYNFADYSSDFAAREYDRSRYSLGVRAEF